MREPAAVYQAAGFSQNAVGMESKWVLFTGWFPKWMQEFRIIARGANSKVSYEAAFSTVLCGCRPSVEG